MVLMVLATLLLTGVVSLFVAARSADTQTRRELVREATGLAASVQQESDTRADPAVALRSLLVALRSSLRLDGSAVLAVRPDGRLFDPATPRLAAALPVGLHIAELQTPSLLDMQTVTGRSGGLVFAAVPYRADIQILGAPRQVVQVVVLTRRPPSVLATAGPWFAVSSLVILALAALVAWRLGRRFTAPLQAAQQVASRIAGGDLDARIPAPPGTEPELAALASSINSMTEGLARAKAAERHFLQSVSHDLRTPLTSIRGFAEAIEDGATPDSVAAAAVIASEARRLERLVGDLLALATLEARRFTLQLQPVDLAAAAKKAADGFAPASAELGLTLGVDGPGARKVAGEAGWVTADPDRLGQVIANLVENALRYARTTVTVATAAGPMPELWVGDDGPGIPPGDRAKVFDRMYAARPRPDGARPGRPIGSGLGLTIVAELVAAMGGTVRVESPLTPAGGTRMVVALPAASAIVTAHRSPTQAPVTGGPRPVGGPLGGT
jgi:signal transduction histidine kinase